MLPSMTVRNSFVNSVMTESTTLPPLVSPMGPPSCCSSALNLCNCCVMRALISGKVALM